MIDTQTLQTQLEQFDRLLRLGDYFEAHEVLETVWFPLRFEPHVEVRFIRGLINAAVSFELCKRARPKAAQKPWHFYQKQLPLLGQLSPARQSLYQKSCATIHAIFLTLKEHYG